MQIIQKYFPNLSNESRKQFELLSQLYSEWNEKINVISRRDIDELYERHVLHSLAISRLIQFQPGSEILDVGTGGGFPAIPLAILFPESTFTACDSIGKKIKVVHEVAQGLGLRNLHGIHANVKQVSSKYDFVVSRAVMRLEKLVPLVRKNISRNQNNALPNGLICLKGGDLQEELSSFSESAEEFDISMYFEEDFFETKKIIYLPL